MYQLIEQLSYLPGYGCTRQIYEIARHNCTQLKLKLAMTISSNMLKESITPNIIGIESRCLYGLFFGLKPERTFCIYGRKTLVKCILDVWKEHGKQVSWEL